MSQLILRSALNGWSGVAMIENKDLIDEVRRHLASAPSNAIVDTFAYANAIEGAFQSPLREIQEVIRREARDLGVACT
jgi:hypothetical protein